MEANKGGRRSKSLEGGRGGDKARSARLGSSIHRGRVRSLRSGRSRAISNTWHTRLFSTIERVLVRDTIQQPLTTCNDTIRCISNDHLPLPVHSGIVLVTRSEITLLIQYPSSMIQTSVRFLARSPLTCSRVLPSHGYKQYITTMCQKAKDAIGKDDQLHGFRRPYTRSKSGLYQVSR